jgi:hypothetical protein
MTAPVLSRRTLLGWLAPLSVLAGPWGCSVTRRRSLAWQDADEPEAFADCFARQHPALTDELRSL